MEHVVRITIILMSLSYLSVVSAIYPEDDLFAYNKKLSWGMSIAEVHDMHRDLLHHTLQSVHQNLPENIVNKTLVDIESCYSPLLGEWRCSIILREKHPLKEENYFLDSKSKYFSTAQRFVDLLKKPFSFVCDRWDFWNADDFYDEDGEFCEDDRKPFVFVESFYYLLP